MLITSEVSNGESKTGVVYESALPLRWKALLGHTVRIRIFNYVTCDMQCYLDDVI